MSKYLIFILFIFSIDGFSAEMIKSRVTINEYYSKYSEAVSKNKCDIDESNMQAYSLLRASFAIEKVENSEHLVRHLVTKDSIIAIDEKDLEMQKIGDVEQQIVCINDNKAIVLRSVISKAVDKDYATGWIVTVKYNFRLESDVLKVSIVQDKHNQDMYSMSEVVKALYFTKISFPYSTYEVRND